VSEVCTNELDAQRASNQLQIEPANVISSSLVHEAPQTATTSGEEDTPGSGNDCTINLVTLHGIWKLTRTATSTDGGDRDSTGLDVDDLFMIPIEESLGSVSSLNELVID
jgi:hypothetical protein